jgi:hypothetical protein
MSIILVGAAVVLPMIIGWLRCFATACSGAKAPL